TALWAPTRLVCFDCIHTLDDAAREVEQDGRCSRCYESGQRLRAMVVTAGTILVTFSLCPACCTREGV
ncbi:MAG: hypothetical protein ACRDVZ_12165, partial [Jiangellaceae bacterium]